MLSDLLAELRRSLSLREMAHLERLLAQPPPGANLLLAQIRDHLAKLQQAKRGNEFLDIALAREIANSLSSLVEGTDSSSDAETIVVAAAVMYFADPDDPAHDTASAIGLEDDARVVTAIARALGRPDLAIEIPT